MGTTVIDTLRLADRLKEAGFEPPHAEGMARALGDELGERMVTKSDLDEAIRPVCEQNHALELRLDTLDAKFDAKFEGLEPRFDAIDAKFEGLELRLDTIDAKFDAKFEGLEPRFDAIDAKFDGLEPRFDAIDVKIESVHRELSGKFNILLGVMALGFTLLLALGGYNAVAPRLAPPVVQAQATQQASELPAMPPVSIAKEE